MALFSKLKIGRDDSGYVTNEIPWGQFSQHYKVKISTGAEETLAVPVWAYHIKYTVAAGGIVWCGFGNGALLPAGPNFVNEVSELNPIVRSVFDFRGDRISTLRFLSENDTFISVIFYRRNNSDTVK